MAILLLILKFFFLAVLFIAIGNIFRSKINWRSEKRGDFFGIAADYFIGFILFFFFLRISSLLIHSFRVATLIAVIIAVIVIIVKRNLIFVPFKTYLKFSLCILPVFIIQLAINVAFWIQADTVSFISSIGSLHSSRYANITHYILLNDSIPILGQNYVQSIVAAIPLTFGDHLVFVSLSILLALTASFLAIFISGLLKPHFADKTSWFFAIILVFCGGLSIMPQFYLLVDSGYPWFLSGYSDTLVGLASYVILVLVLIESSEKLFAIQIWHWIFLTVSIVCWFALGIQNVLLLGILVLIFFIVQIRKKQFSQRLFLIFCGVFLSATIVGVLEGGMVTPASLQSKVAIPGLQSVKRPNKSVIQIMPGLPHYVFNYNKTGNQDETFLWLGLKKHNTGIIMKGFHALGLPVFFIVFLTFVLSLSWVKKNYENIDEMRNEQIFIYVSILTFTCALFIVIPFSIFSYKWELSRFLIPGYFLCSVLTAIMFYNWGNTLKRRSGKLILIGLTIFLCTGTLAYLSKEIQNNFTLRDFRANLSLFCAPFDDFISKRPLQ